MLPYKETAYVCRHRVNSFGFGTVPLCFSPCLSHVLSLTWGIWWAGRVGRIWTVISHTTPHLSTNTRTCLASISPRGSFFILNTIPRTSYIHGHRMPLIHIHYSSKAYLVKKCYVFRAVMIHNNHALPCPKE